MYIDIKCFASLACHTPQGGSMELDPASTVAMVMQILHMDPAEVKIIFINGVHATPESVLQNGDRLGLIPAVGGG